MLFSAKISLSCNFLPRLNCDEKVNFEDVDEDTIDNHQEDNWMNEETTEESRNTISFFENEDLDGNVFDIFSSTDDSI